MKPDRLVYDVPEAGALLGMSRNAAYAAAKRGDIPTVKIGKLLRVPVRALEEMLNGAAVKGPEVAKSCPRKRTVSLSSKETTGFFASASAMMPQVHFPTRAFALGVARNGWPESKSRAGRFILGRFDDPKKAGAAYMAALNKYFGDFANEEMETRRASA